MACPLPGRRGQGAREALCPEGGRQRRLDETTAAVVTGRYVDPKAGRVTVSAFAAQWRSSLVHRDGYLRIIDNALTNYIVPTFGDRALSTLRRSDVQTFVPGLAQQRRPTAFTTSTGCCHSSWARLSMT